MNEPAEQLASLVLALEAAAKTMSPPRRQCEVAGCELDARSEVSDTHIMSILVCSKHRDRWLRNDIVRECCLDIRSNEGREGGDRYVAHRHALQDLATALLRFADTGKLPGQRGKP